MIHFSVEIIRNVKYAQKLPKNCLNVLYVKMISQANLKAHKVHENKKNLSNVKYAQNLSKNCLNVLFVKKISQTN